MQPAPPVWTVELFPPLNAALRRFLSRLEADVWRRPTACAPWTIKDVAAHLLGGNLGRLVPEERFERLVETPREREVYAKLLPRWQTAACAPLRDDSPAGLIELIDRQNARWVTAARDLSPAEILAALTVTDRHLYRFFRHLSPWEQAPIAVAWAGDSVSPNWLDIAREFTEKWHHQQHIREGAGHPPLLTPRFLRPVLATFARALPVAYRDRPAAAGLCVSFRFTGPGGSHWAICRQGGAWILIEGAPPGPAATVTLHVDLAWRLFTRGIRPADALPRIDLSGDRALALPFLDSVAIMAT